MSSYHYGGPLPRHYGNVSRVVFNLKSNYCKVYRYDSETFKLHKGWEKNWEKFEFLSLIDEWFGPGVYIEFEGKQPKDMFNV